MSKRFTDSEKWKDEWFLSLPNDYRIIWLYIIDSCDWAGIFKKNFRMLNFCCNTTITEDKFKEIFVGRVIDCGSFFFIPKFLKFQYPKGLNSNKPTIVSVRNILKENNLFPIVKKSLGNDYLIIKDKDKDKDKEEECEREELESYNSLSEVPPSAGGNSELIALRNSWAESLGILDENINSVDGGVLADRLSKKGLEWCLAAVEKNKLSEPKEKAMTAKQAFFFYDKHCRESPKEKTKPKEETPAERYERYLVKTMNDTGHGREVAKKILDAELRKYGMLPKEVV